jgi:DNA polymerase-3 subunit gamma/tau
MATALLGYTDSALLDEVVDAFAAHDGATVFQVIDRVVEGGHDPRRFVTDLLERLRDLVILATVPDAGEKGLIDAPADRVAVMQAQADAFGAAELSRAADIVNTGLTEMRGNAAPRLQLELICARVMLPGAYSDELSLQARLDKLERRAAAGGFAAAAGVAPMAPAAAPMGAPMGVPSMEPPASVAAPAPVAQVVAPPVAAPVQPAPVQPAPVQAPPPSAPAGPAPGAWPIPRSFPPAGGAPAPAASPASQPQAAPAPAPVAAPAPAPVPTPAPAVAAPGGQPSAAAQQGAAQVRQLWPQILEAVKNRRRFTWILLSQNGQVAGFDGSVLQVSFINAGARDSFVGSNSDDVLRQALADALGVDWRIECIVDPSGGAGAAPSAAPAGGGWGAPARPAAAAPPMAAPAPAPTPAPVQQAPAPVQPQPQAQAPAPVQARPPAAVPQARPVQSVAPEDDIPEEDDPDLNEEAFSGQELIIRELGATVLEEIHHRGN